MLQLVMIGQKACWAGQRARGATLCCWMGEMGVKGRPKPPGTNTLQHIYQTLTKTQNPKLWWEYRTHKFPYHGCHRRGEILHWKRAQAQAASILGHGGASRRGALMRFCVSFTRGWSSIICLFLRLKYTRGTSTFYNSNRVADRVAVVRDTAVLRVRGLMI